MRKLYAGRHRKDSVVYVILQVSIAASSANLQPTLPPEPEQCCFLKLSEWEARPG